jgi:hypothetical protein
LIPTIVATQSLTASRENRTARSVGCLLVSLIEECKNGADLVTLQHQHVDASDDGFLSIRAESPIEPADAVKCLRLAALCKDKVGKPFDKLRSCVLNSSMPLVAGVVIDEDSVLRPQSCDVALALLNVMLPEDAMQVFTQQRFDCSCHAVPSQMVWVVAPLHAFEMPVRVATVSSLRTIASAS